MHEPCQIQDLIGHPCGAPVENLPSASLSEGGIGLTAGECYKCGSIACDRHAIVEERKRVRHREGRHRVRVCIACTTAERIGAMIGNLKRVQSYFDGSMLEREWRGYARIVESELDTILADLTTLRSELPNALEPQEPLAAT